jgi:hypothetical protein
MSITIKLPFDIIFPEASHCDFTFNQQRLYYRMFVAFDVEMEIFIEPNFV